jgi:hypothetical protein
MEIKGLLTIKPYGTYFNNSTNIRIRVWDVWILTAVL